MLIDEIPSRFPHEGIFLDHQKESTTLDSLKIKYIPYFQTGD